jgi:hypothetical protein
MREKLFSVNFSIGFVSFQPSCEAVSIEKILLERKNTRKAYFYVKNESTLRAQDAVNGERMKNNREEGETYNILAMFIINDRTEKITML